MVATKLIRKSNNFAFQSLIYSLKDKRKRWGFIIIISLAFIDNLWQFIPKDFPFPYYGYLNVFVYSFCNEFSICLIGIAWFMIIQRKDFALQLLSLALIAYGLFTTVSTLPFTMYTPFWLEVLIVVIFFAIITSHLHYVHKTRLNKSIDYKELHDGIVHDLHHQKFRNHIARLEGLINIAEMEEPYKSFCQKEITDIKEAVTYIGDKYQTLE